MIHVFSTAYLPPLSYVSKLLNSDALIDIHEHYQKQSYRNRAIILTANGPLSLSIPVIKTNGNHTPVKDIKISYDEKWQSVHWRAIESAYSKAPYFLYLEDEIKPYYSRKFKFLIDFNTALLQSLLNFLKLKKELRFSEQYIEKDQQEITDLRSVYSPKKTSLEKKTIKAYTQVFSDRFDFIGDLSILDLILNEGLLTIDYLSE